jgi:hypothetical protein
MDLPQPLFDRTIGRPRPWWVTLAISLLLLALPFAVVYKDGVWALVSSRGLWRTLLAPPIIIIYTLVIAPFLERMGAEVTVALRPLTPIDDEHFQRLVKKYAYISPRDELLAIAFGLALGLWLGWIGGFSAQQLWLRAYWVLASGFMWGILVWVIYLSLVSTRLPTALHRELVKVDIFDLAPFEPIGRQSLLLALVFVGGVTISLLFSLQPSNLHSPVYWLIYLLLGLVPVVVFFLNMRPTHQVLSTEKTHQLKAVRDQLSRTASSLMQRLEDHQDVGALPAEVNALIAFEGRLKETRTWPYNTGTLRTLFFSVLIPLVTVLARLAVEVLFQ